MTLAAFAKIHVQNETIFVNLALQVLGEITSGRNVQGITTKNLAQKIAK